MQPRFCGVIVHAEGGLLMVNLEGEIAEHLAQLFESGLEKQHAGQGGALRGYIGTALIDWGFTIARLASPQQNGVPQRDGVVGWLGYGPLGRVQLRARLQGQASGDQGLGGVAVLLALSRLLSQYQLRYGLEVVVFSGASERLMADVDVAKGLAAEAGPSLAAVCFDNPGLLAAPNRLGIVGGSTPLAAGARRLLARYPDIAWDDRRITARSDGPGFDGLPLLWVGAGPQPPGFRSAYSPPRLREAAMLGAEIVALLQTHTPASCRPGELAA